VALLHKVMEWASETEAWREGGGGERDGKEKMDTTKIQKHYLPHTNPHPPKKVRKVVTGLVSAEYRDCNQGLETYARR
jgi:hypothetical protein